MTAETSPLLRFRDPRVLLCGHIFCRECITTWINLKNHCPTCKRYSTVENLVKPYIIDDIVNSEQANVGVCDDCKDNVDQLANCVHCDKSLCSLCVDKHAKKVKEEVRRLCTKMIYETTPELAKYRDSIVNLMSEATHAKEKLLRDLKEAHESLVFQICTLSEKSLNLLGNVEKKYNLESQTQVEDIDSLIARIETISTASAEVIEKRDLKKLVQLDAEISELQKDIGKFQSREKNLSFNSSKMPFTNLQINPAYKLIVDFITETDMLRKADPS